jgi:hypothetical protein
VYRQFHSVYTPEQIHIHSVKFRGQEIAILIKIVFEQREGSADTCICEDVVDGAVVRFCGFEERDLLGPGCDVNFQKGSRGGFGRGEWIDVAGEDLATMFEDAAECCEADS